MQDNIYSYQDCVDNNLIENGLFRFINLVDFAIDKMIFWLSAIDLNMLVSSNLSSNLNDHYLISADYIFFRTPGIDILTIKSLNF